MARKSEPKTERLSKASVSPLNLLNGFIISKQAEGCSKNTTGAYQKDLRQFINWCDGNGNHDLTKLNANDLKAFIAFLRTQPSTRGKPLSPKSCYNVWVSLKSFYRWRGEETGTVNPMATTVPAPKLVAPLIEPLARDQLAAILKACEGTRQAETNRRSSFSMRRNTATRDKAIILTLVDTGLRASELCNLKMNDIDLTNGQIIVRCGKGGKPRIVYVGKTIRKALWRYLSERQPKPDDPWFLTRDNRAFKPDRLQRLLRRIGERANVDGLHPHQLKHTFTTEALRNGMNLLALQRLLGHSGLNMVRRYVALVEADLAKAHETGSPADKWRL